MNFRKLLPDLPFPQPVISKAFKEQHERYLEHFPEWSLLATRRKLIVSYWLKILVNHFVFFILSGCLIVLLFTKWQSVPQLMLSLLPAALLTFIVLYLTMYWPLYHLDFLPHLDSYMESFNNKKLEGIQKCKKDQYSVLTLMLIQYVYQQMMGFEFQIKTENIQLLARQYGVSEKSIGTSMLLILRCEWDRKSVRKRTEIINDFEVAKNYLRELSFKKGVLLLYQLEQKILK